MTTNPNTNNKLNTAPNSPNNLITQKHIAEMEQRYRATFINSLSGYKSANLIGTVSTSGVTNLAVFNSVFHVGANPPLLGMVFRPHTVRRDTLENILDHGQYTINHIHAGITEQAHQTSAKYDENESEFDATGLNPFYTPEFNAPYVKESYINIGLQCREVIPVKANDTIIIIGEILEVICPSSAIQEDGFIKLEKLHGTAINGLDSYYLPSKIARYSYATPQSALTQKD